jgi:hypothetical protein
MLTAALTRKTSVELRWQGPHETVGAVQEAAKVTRCV